MRISDWSSDVCSSDLIARPGATTSAVLRALAITLPFSVGAELVEALFFLCNVGKQERPFDKLRANGVEIQPLARISRAAAAIESRLGNVSVDRKSTRLNSSH